jgi:hypothetical protein
LKVHDIIVLGSGLSSSCVVRTLLEVGKKVLVIDAAKDNTNLASEKEFQKFKNQFKSPKFRFRKNSYVYSDYDEILNLITSNFKAVGSLAEGGLSNIWGAGLDPYDDKELDCFPYDYKSIEPTYHKLLSELTNVNNPKVLLRRYNEFVSKQRYSDDGNGLFFPINAVFTKQTKNRNKCINHQSCLSGCPTDSIYSAKHAFSDMRNSENLTIIPNLIVETVTKDSGIYRINVKDINSENTKIFYANTIFCCLGTLSSTKIAMQLVNNININSKLLSTPGCSFIAQKIHGKKINASTGINLSRLKIKMVVENVSLSGNLFQISKELIASYFGASTTKFIPFSFYGSTFIGNIFFPSEFSNNTISFNNNNIITINTKKSLLSDSSFLKSTKKKLKYVLANSGYYMVPGSFSELNPGEDIHYGGTIPMGNNQNQLGCNIYGELNNYKGFYLADASSMPSLAGKGHTFNMMANASFIVESFLSK